MAQTSILTFGVGDFTCTQLCQACCPFHDIRNDYSLPCTQHWLASPLLHYCSHAHDFSPCARTTLALQETVVHLYDDVALASILTFGVTLYAFSDTTQQLKSMFLMERGVRFGEQGFWSAASLACSSLGAFLSGPISVVLGSRVCVWLFVRVVF